MTQANAAKSYGAIQNPEPTAIVIYCSDPRFQKAFDEFIEQELGLKKGEFIPLVIAGGAGVLARPEQLPKEFKFIKERIELFISHFSSISRIVLINHEDCAYYKTLKDRVLGFIASHLTHSKDDLSIVEKILRRLLQKTNIELYYARFQNPERIKIVFEKI